jgi:exosome complex component RRP41
MTTATFEAFLTDLRDLADKFIAEQNGKAIATAPPARTKAKPAKAVEKDVEDDDDPQAARRAELSAMTETALKRLAAKLGYEKSDIEESTSEEIIGTILTDEREAAEAEAEEEEEEEAEEEETGAYERDDLIGQGLVALKKIAKDEFGQTTASLKGLDKESIIAIILGEDEDEEDEDEEDEEAETEEEEEDEADDEEEEDDEEEDTEITEDYLKSLSDAELKAKATAWGYTVRPRMKRDAIIDLFFEE